jgi:Na+-transporting methylmalonyl-CoA/oxaloacetate decarboxylase gamma subunit
MLKLLGEGAKFSLIAQSMVFLVLFLLALVILAMKFIFYRPVKAAETGQTQAPEERPPGPAEDVLEVAAIAAALEMHQQARSAELSPGIGQEGPWAPRPGQGRAVNLQSRARRWSHG